jgi:hypothetical protein
MNEWAWAEMLVAFIPEIEALDPEQVTIWPDQEPVYDEHGRRHITINYHYHPTVDRLFDAMIKMADQPYDKDLCEGLVGAEGDLMGASLDEIRQVMTWMVRGERFCWGHFGDVVSDGTALRVLRRLEKLLPA